jgi:hypothetical protein
MTAFSKNLLLALIPLALAAVGYLFQASIAMHDRLSVIEQKMSILVDMDNRIIPSPDNAIARNQIKMELQDDLHDLDKRLSLLEAVILGKK